MTNKEQLLARAKEIMEATLGGAKYKGKDNPNNAKLVGPGVNKRSDDKSDEHMVARHKLEAQPKTKETTHKIKREFQALRAANKVQNRPNIDEDDVEEATLGGAKYKGKENPNNEKKKNRNKADDAITRHTVKAMRAAAHSTPRNERTSNRHWNAVDAAKRIRPKD